MKKVAIFGLWHQGVVASACMADIGYDVIGVDNNKDYINNLNKGKAPLFEPGLDDLLKKGLKKGNLNFTTNVLDSLKGIKEIMIMFDVKVNESDESDLSEIFDLVDFISPNLEQDVVLYFTSQMPVGTCNKIIDNIKDKNPKLNFGVAYSPENLRLGKAIELFLKPALPVIGSDNLGTFLRIEELLSPLGVDWKHVNLNTSEMTKHALNAYLAISISFANEVGNLCDEVGADGYKIAEVLRMEPRVGEQAMLLPGLGFSGATLARDVQTLRSLSDHFKLKSLLLDGVWESNKIQNKLVQRKLRKIYDSLEGLPVSVMGLTYKPDTSTLRRSAAIEIINDLVNSGVVVSCHDPKADRKELSSFGQFRFCEDPYEAIKNTKALILITPWKDYLNLDFEKIKKIMAPNPLVIDTANIWDADSLKEKNFIYFGIGRGGN